MADTLKNVIAQSLECPVCLNTFTDPKILSCSHTYCKACLDNLLGCNGNDQMLRCPVCRAETQVPNQEVSKLPANLALKSLIEDMKNQYQFCSNCKSEDRPEAVVYCQDCGRYFCITCHKTHSQWPVFISHEVLAMSEIVSGKVSVRRYRKCRKHPKEDEECFCSDCRRFACFRCVVMEHTNEGHRVIEAAVYESSHVKSIEDLKSKADKKRSCFQKYVDFIDEQKDRVSNVQKQCTDDINKAYEDSVRQLTKEKEILIGEVNGMTEGVEKELDEMKKSAQEHITYLTTIADVVTNKTKIPLDMDALAAHDTLCQDLQEALKQEDPDYKQSIQSSKKGKSVSFKRNVGMDELGLGKIVNAVAKNIALPTKDSMNDMVGTPDGRMAVGCGTGGVEIFCADGQHQQTVLKDAKIVGLGFLSDDRYVVLNRSNNITLYTPEYTKLNVMFETLSHDEGELSSLAVDDDDQIYVISYSVAEKIQVFSPAGGKAIREIPCDGYIPVQFTNYNDYLITESFDTIRLIDKQGVVKYQLTKSGVYLTAAVSQGNTILIATVKDDESLVSIDEYTNELKHVQNLVTDYKVETNERGLWYTLQQYRSGEIAFCTPDRLYIFY
ncbi:tripartite motif-containing protein 45-like [Strongylocentrotus purpuratus]|uniref:Uncharacterized protein n=1 Tax=Strongylocentrotus purpuratus TaxID=7668 RepID=A0A7M7PBJ5_STRPU|nr:tripartite motif-containing protein 45-like [Strongylocentrotus purpuratus]XP_030847907.1 tripartite motif-containing protein 45-like [Strongylocentrotus purpuratus]|eukprot:XP_011661272.1 PREDICTED: tripartite motif-containing protein 45-like [Strongylocentrotus purpuratus]